MYTDADGVEHNYPGNYGLTTCMAWDLDLPPTCADSDGMPLVDAPDFCGQNWCYVGETCLQGALESTYFPDQGLKYSYDVCAQEESLPEAESDEVCPGIKKTGAVWWDAFLLKSICPEVEAKLEEELAAANEAAAEAGGEDGNLETED